MKEFMACSSPSEIALIKMVDARMKMMSDALPNISINRLTTCWPTMAATKEMATKYNAAGRTGRLVVPTAVPMNSDMNSKGIITVWDGEPLKEVIFYDGHRRGKCHRKGCGST